MAASLLLICAGCISRSRAPDALPALAPTGKPIAAVLTSVDAGDPWFPIAQAASAAHGDAPILTFSPDDPASIIAALAPAESGDAILVVPPGVIDVNFAWRLLTLASSLDDDPFVDVRYGFLTGATPDDALAFLQRSAQVRAGSLAIAPRLLDCFGPNQLDTDKVIVHRRLFWAGWLSGKLKCRGMNNGRRGFADGSLDTLAGHGVYHFGGHGYPDRIDQGLTAEQLSRADLGTSIAFNGACSTGVTDRAFERSASGWSERRYAPDDSFCLTMLNQPVVAYLAATHPDHGVPVYQEMEHLFTTGGSMGEAIKHTYDAVVIGNSGKLPAFPKLSGGAPIQPMTPTEIMLTGSASRVLYGDPTLQVMGALASPGLSVETIDAVTTVTIENPDIAYSLMDTFHCDLAAQQNGFNDRTYVRIPWDASAPPSSVDAVASSRGQAIRSRVVGYAVESWGGEQLLHVQVDVESSGYQQGPIRRKGATIELTPKP